MISKTPSKLKPSHPIRALSSAGKVSLLGSKSISLSSSQPLPGANGNNLKGMRLNELEDLPRKRRLMVMALQIPQVDNLLTSISVCKIYFACKRRFDIWKSKTEQKKKEDEVYFLIRLMMAITIQKVVRGMLGRRRVIRIKQRIAQEKNARFSKFAHLFHALARKYLWKKQFEIVMNQQKSIRLEYAARTIQKYFRGYLGRGQIILIERKKLLKYLRQWSHGLTNHLYHLTDLQDAEPLAVIHTAISFTTLPSKPIRNLPSLSKIKQYRAGLYLLFWQVRGRYHKRKLELQQIVKERRLMHNEELYSLTREIVAKAFADKIRLQKEQLEITRKRDELEMERRQNFQAAQFLSDLHNKKQQGVREDQEKKRRENLRHLQEQEFIQQQFQFQLSREREMMTFEDRYAMVCRHNFQEYRDKIYHLKLEKQNILTLQEKIFFHEDRHDGKDYEVKLVSKQNKHLFFIYQDLLCKFREVDIFLTNSVINMFVESLGLRDGFISEFKSSIDRMRSTWSTPLSSLSSEVNAHKHPATLPFNYFIETFVKDVLRSCHFNYAAVNKYLTPILKESAAINVPQRRYRPTRRGTMDLLMRSNRMETNFANSGNLTNNSLSSIGSYRLRYEMLEYLFRQILQLSGKVISPSPISMYPAVLPYSHNLNDAKTSDKCIDKFNHPWKDLLRSKNIIASCQWIVDDIDIPRFVRDEIAEVKVDGSGIHNCNTSNVGSKTMAPTTLPFTRDSSVLSFDESSLASCDHSEDAILPKFMRCKVAIAHGCSRIQLTRYKEYLQYRYLTKKCFESQQSLIFAIHQFECKHIELEKLRKEKLQKGKLALRSQRKGLLEEAIALEKVLENLRKDIIYHSSFLTDYMYFLVRMMLDVFFYSDGNEHLKKSDISSSEHNIQNKEMWYSSENEDGWGGMETFTSSAGLCVYFPSRTRSRAKSRGRGAERDNNTDSKSSTGSPSLRSNGQKGAVLPINQKVTYASTGQSQKANINTARSSQQSTGRSNSRRKRRKRKSRSLKKSRMFDMDGEGFDSVAFRKFDIEKDDHEQYWKDLFDFVAPIATSSKKSSDYSDNSKEQSRWRGISALDLLRLPAPPIPMYHHDGRRHMIKVITSTSVKKKTPGKMSSGRVRPANLSISVSSTSAFSNAGSVPSTPKMSSSTPKAGATPTSSSSKLAASPSHRVATPSPPKKRPAGNPLQARLSKKFERRRGKNNTTVEEDVKEQKFYDIPGENMFLETTVTDYDFFHWAIEVDAWARDCSEFISYYENEWKRNQMQESYPSLATEMFAYYQRYHYLSLDHHEYEHPPEAMEMAASAPSDVNPHLKFWQLPKIPSYQNLQDEKTNCAIMNKIALSKAVDLLEFRFLKSDLVVGLISTSEGTLDLSVGDDQCNIPKRVIPISGKVLEDVIGRQSSSLYLRLLMENKIRQEEKLSFSSYQGLLQRTASISNRFSIPTWDEVIVKNTNELFAGFDRENICSLLNCIQKEREELKDSLITIVKNQWLRVDSAPALTAPPPTNSLSATFSASWDDGDNSGNNSPSLLQTRSLDSFEAGSSNDEDDQSQTSWFSSSTQWILRLAIPLSPLVSNSKSIDYNIDCSQATEHSWFYFFPRYMFPILHFGSYCGKESFFKRLQREKKRKSSKDSSGSGMKIYSLIDEIDERCDYIARATLTFTKVRKELKKALMERVRHRLYQDEMFQHMKYEDARSHVLRFDEQEKIRLKELQAFEKKRQKSIFDSCLPWFNRSYAKIHVSQISPALRQQIEVLKNQPQQRNQWIPYRQTTKVALQLDKIVDDHQKRCKVDGNRPFLSIFEEPVFLSFCEEHSSRLCDEYGKPLNISQLQQSMYAMHAKCLDPTSYFRQCSWITGQKVFLNENGEHFNPVEMIFPKLATMSSIYDDTNSALHLSTFNTFNHQTNTVEENQVVTLQSHKHRNSCKLHSSSFKLMKTKRNKAKMPKDGQEKRRSNHVQEVYIAGSMQKVLVLLRVVEDEMVTDRGNIVLESFDRNDIHWIDQFHDLSWTIQSALNPNSQPHQQLHHGHSNAKLMLKELNQDKLAFFRCGFQCFPISDGDRRSYAQCLVVNNHSGTIPVDGHQFEKLRYLSLDNYRNIYGHEANFQNVSIFKGGALPNVHSVWRDLAVTVFRKRYLSVLTDYRILTGLRKLQAMVRGMLCRRQRGITGSSSIHNI